MGPTYDRTARFDRDWDGLSPTDREHFRQMVTKFVADLETGGSRKGLRVKRVEGTPNVYVVTFAPDGRTTWEYGEPVLEGEHHAVFGKS